MVKLSCQDFPFCSTIYLPCAKVAEDTSLRQRVKIAVTVIAHGSDLNKTKEKITNTEF